MLYCTHHKHNHAKKKSSKPPLYISKYQFFTTLVHSVLRCGNWANSLHTPNPKCQRATKAQWASQATGGVCWSSFIL